MQSRPLRNLIDGYNVLFQSQLVGRGRRAGWLDNARGRLLQLFESGLSQQDLLHTEVIFDAAKHGPTPADDILRSGLVVTFARQYPEADDLIEERIRQHPHPKSLRVVSADHRIIRRAKTRRAVVCDPESFLQELEQAAPLESQPTGIIESVEDSPVVRNSQMDEDEVEFWLEEFDLRNGDDNGNRRPLDDPP